MAEDDWRKRREREDAIERDNEGQAAERKLEADADMLRLKFEEAEKLIDILQSKYNQFMLGLEHKPPLDMRSKLDRLIAELLRTPKPTQVLTFRWGTLQSSYASHKERWDRGVKAVESGKVKRLIKREGPRGGA
jgi:hypothetical protein